MTGDLRVSEVYLSVQGEGPNVGLPTVFVRFAGCNLRCPAWPCDTPHAIFPEKFRQEWKSLAPNEVAALVAKVAGCPGTRICYTGGEPFLQRSAPFAELSDRLADTGYPRQEVFTNGTLRFPDWALDNLYFILDWKLPGSGETFAAGRDGGTFASNRIANVRSLSEGDSVKFTIADEVDYTRAVDAWFAMSDLPVQAYYGVVWGKMEPKDLIARVLRDNLPWRYNHQLHNVIWNREERGI